MGCASVLAVWDLVWVILGWKWSLVPQPSVRHSHNFKSIKSSFHKEHLDCQRQTRRANMTANANVTTSRGRLLIFTTLTEQWKSNEQQKEEGKCQEKKFPKERCDRKTERNVVLSKSDWLAGRQGDADRQLPSIPDDTVLVKCTTYLLDAKNTWQG